MIEKIHFRTPAIYALFLIIILAVYGFSIGNNYNLDDELVIDNKFIGRDLSVIPEIFNSAYADNGEVSFGYRPIVILSYYLETYFFGVDATVSHSINLILYFFCCLILYEVLQRCFRANITVALLAVLCFLVMPIHVEVVASAKNRDELLAMILVGCLYLTTITTRNGKLRPILLIFPLFAILSLLSKKSALPAIVLLPLYHIIFQNATAKTLVFYLINISVLLFFFSPIYKEFLNIIFIALFNALYTLLFIFQNIELREKGWRIVRENYNQLLLGVSIILIFIYPPIVPLISIVWFIVLIFSNQQYISLLSILSILTITYFWADQSSILLINIFVGCSFFHWHHSKLKKTTLIAIICVNVGLFSYDYIFLTLNYINILPVLVLALGGLSISRKGQKPYLSVISIVWIAFSGIYLLLANGYNMYGFSLCIITLTMVVWHFIDLKRGYIKFLPLLITIIYIVINPGKFAYFTNESDMLSDDLEEVNLYQDIGRELHPTENVFITDISTPSKVATSLDVLGRYLLLHVWPNNLRFYYGYAHIDKASWTQVFVWLSLLIHIGLLFTALFFLQKNKLLAFGIIFYLASIFAFSNLLVPVAGMMGERLAFFASFGFSILLGCGFHYVYNRNGWWKIASIFLLTIFLCANAVVAGVRSTAWKDKLTLYLNDIEYTPKSAKMNQLLGSLYYDISKVSRNEDHLANAVYYMDQAKEIYPEYYMYYVISGLAYQEFHYYNNAIQEYKNAIAYKPSFTDPYFNIAVCAEGSGDAQTAIQYYNLYMDKEPDNQNVYANLSYFYFRMGNIEDAVSTLHKAISKFPRNPDHHLNLAKIYLNLGDTQQAIEFLKNAADLGSSDPQLYQILLPMIEESAEDDEYQRYYLMYQSLIGNQ